MKTSNIFQNKDGGSLAEGSSLMVSQTAINHTTAIAMVMTTLWIANGLEKPGCDLHT